MKLNWVEKWVVNNPARSLEQRFEMGWLKKKMPLNEGAQILEIGCGRGAGAGLIVEAFQPSRLYAFDLDIDMVQKAKKPLPMDAGETISLFVGDALHLPFQKDSLDAVFGFGFLHHVVDWRGALAEIARVLRKGGVYFMEELYPALYQNFITRHLLLHPRSDRFHSDDLRQGLDDLKMPVKEALELKKWGILAVAVKES
ncbi:MAG: class I SAM-dependent methyltransferase [Pseudomonadota bacterium]